MGWQLEFIRGQCQHNAAILTGGPDNLKHTVERYSWLNPTKSPPVATGGLSLKTNH